MLNIPVNILLSHAVRGGLSFPVQQFGCSDSRRSDIGESDSSLCHQTISRFILLFCRSASFFYFFIFSSPCWSYKTLTHLRQTKSDHACCLRCSVFTLYCLIFNFRLRLKRRHERRRDKKKMQSKSRHTKGVVTDVSR